MAGYGFEGSFDRVVQMHEIAQQSIGRISQLALSPEQQKTPKKFGIAEVAHWLGKSTTAVRNLESAGVVEVERNKQGNRRYTLEDIFKMREHWGLLPQWEGEHQAPVIVVGNHKGGVSKSILSVHYAVNSARRGLKTLLVDMDAQATATSFFYTLPHEEFSLEDTAGLVFKDPEEDLSKTIIGTHWYGLDLIPSCLELGQIDTGLLPNARPGQFSDERRIGNRLRMHLEHLREAYDLIIMDTSPNLSISVLASMAAATGLVIPLQPAIPDFSSSREFFYSLIGLMGAEEAQFTFERMVFTRVLGFKGEGPVKDFLRTQYGNAILRNELLNSAEIKGAADIMETIYDLDSNIGAKATYERAVGVIRDVCDEINGLVFPEYPILKAPQNARLF